MKKLKIYLDTSVISHLDAPDVPDKEADTKRLWEKIRAGEFDVCISPVVVLELNDCHEPKLSGLLTQMRSIRHTTLEETNEVLELASKYIEAGILRKKSFNDCRHVAHACVYGCDMIVSWNFKHLVNYKTVAGVKSVNALAGYREMLICAPTFLVEGGTEDDS
jgi:predicted nucleic acid-binding protein